MRENNVRKIWNSGGAVLNGWLTIPSAWTAEIMANQQWDSVTVDMQHGLIGYESALSMLQAISTTDTVPLGRSSWNEPVTIMKLLDAGAYGIICPMVNTREEAERFVGACRYAPLGYRSAGPTRAMLYAKGDYMGKANETIVTIAMIETAEAVANVDDIMSVPGLDAVYIGPTDLAISLGLAAGGALDQPRLGEAIDTVLKAGVKHGVIPGIHCNAVDDAKRSLEKGFRFVTALSDSRILSMAVNDVVRQVRAGGQAGYVPY